MVTDDRKHDLFSAILGGLFALLICTMFARLEWKQRLFEQKEKSRQERQEKKRAKAKPAKISLSIFNHSI